MSLGDVYIAEETMHDRLEERRSEFVSRRSPGQEGPKQPRWLARHGCSLLCKLGKRLVAVGAWLETRGQLASEY